MLISVTMLAGVLGQAGAQESSPPSAAAGRAVTVGVRVSPPFVMRTDDGFTGLAVELWEALAPRLGLAWEYEGYDTVRDLVAAAAAGEVDVAVTNLTVTENRARRIDFTQPWFDGGLRILTNSDRGTGFQAVFAGLRDSGFLRAYAWIGLIILAATVLMTLFYRRFDSDFPTRWRDGFAESFYNVMVIATSGRMAPGRNFFGWIGRIFQGIWLFAGIALIAYVTSTVTSVMTTLSLTNQIHGVDDLAGKTVGVLEGSVSEDFAREAGLRYQAFLQIDEAAEALLRGRIAAVIEDTGVIEYYAKTHPDLPLDVVGRIFEPDKYAFGLPRNSDLVRPLTIEILRSHEQDEIQDLRTKYFGDDS
ncbi:transporter substrate-binding domain-containing protein [Chelativorans sp. AA-79]|uniref:transporter substrate-binding domain-containing protein n=1 Tax=Chelativorans sp. AA-79 TaxID=3028735 RepID=UPI0023F75973|nr:transporter substrate-binding domain-containing protein [Chelativorans sp. AA-79]WEX11082.1 transporter substrate-binding domain-containing protein [Chelativorans sp. AA-79]